jgi:hypothetical protein
VPNAPSNCAATADGQTITITWSDDSDNETRFEIQASEGDPTFSSPEQFSTPANAEQHNLDGAEPQVTYYLRVRACNSSGCSGWSNVASVASYNFAFYPVANRMICKDSAVDWDAGERCDGRTVEPDGEIMVGNSFVGYLIDFSSRFHMSVFKFGPSFMSCIAGRQSQIKRATFYMFACYINPDVPWRQQRISAFSSSWNPATINYEILLTLNTYESHLSIISGPSGDNEWVVFDITGIVRQWASGAWANNGILVDDPDYEYPYYDVAGHATYCSIEGLGCSASCSNKPTILIEFYE